jgi:hypothetical protein
VPSSGSNKNVVIILILVGSLGAAAAAVCTCLFFVLRRRKSRVGSLEEDQEKWMRFDILGKGLLELIKQHKHVSKMSTLVKVRDVVEVSETRCFR